MVFDFDSIAKYDYLCYNGIILREDGAIIMVIEITWSDGRITCETGHNPCINQSEYSAESLYKLICTMAAWHKEQPQPVSYREV